MTNTHTGHNFIKVRMEKKKKKVLKKNNSIDQRESMINNRDGFESARGTRRQGLETASRRTAQTAVQANFRGALAHGGGNGTPRSKLGSG